MTPRRLLTAMAATALVVLSILVFFVLGPLLFTTPIEISEDCVSSYREAQEGEFVDKGWIPAFVPKDSHDLCWEGNLDTAKLVLYYQFDTVAFEAVDVSSINLPPKEMIPIIKGRVFHQSGANNAYSIGEFTVLVNASDKSVLLWN